MKILFITRSYSKNKGGKEIYNYNLVQALRKKENLDIKLIVTSGSIFKLLWFYPYALIKGIFSLKNVSNIHLGDNFMLPIGRILSKLSKSKLSLTLYGLELTYLDKLYRFLFVRKINNCDLFIAISKATKKEAIKQGISEKKIKVVPCGINENEFEINKTKEQCIKILENKYKISLRNKKIILTAGRLVKRKGIVWFVENVMPKLGNNYAYLISGEGEEYSNIKNSIIKNKLQNRVFLLGRTNFQTLKLSYNLADVFVMPNIIVKGDMEGFGIVALEANSVGLPVVASNIEGIKDAVMTNKTGYLVKEKDINGFIEKIKSAEKLNKKDIAKIVNSNFTWSKIADMYREVWGG